VVLARDLRERIAALTELGLGYLSADRATPALSAGELQRIRLATQLRSGLFGVLYVLDEPSAGLHPADTESLLKALHRLKDAGNSVFMVEHNMDLVRRADWIVDVGPGPGEHGGQVLHSGPVPDLAGVEASATRRYVFRADPEPGHPASTPREPSGWLELRGVTRHNLVDVDLSLPLGLFTAVTGVSGSGKSTLVSQVLAEVVADHLHVSEADTRQIGAIDDEADELEEGYDDAGLAPGEAKPVTAVGLDLVNRLVQVDQKPIGRTPRSNLATYTGMFDAVRKVFASTEDAQRRGYGVGRFSFNVKGGRCETCQGEGFVSVGLLFLPETYAPCPVCRGARYNPETLEIAYRGRNIAEVLQMTVDEAAGFLSDVPAAARSLTTLERVGLGYLRLGQPATSLSGGEAQRIKLATELQRARRGKTLYLLDEPTTGLHPADVERLMSQLHGLVSAGNTVVVIEHDMDVAAGADWVIDLGPGGGDRGGRIVATGTPTEVASAGQSATAYYLAKRLGVMSS
jgi:excinuclease ABC subunit A